jgi:hypothetical protein
MVCLALRVASKSGGCLADAGGLPPTIPSLPVVPGGLVPSEFDVGVLLPGGLADVGVAVLAVCEALAGPV